MRISHIVGTMVVEHEAHAGGEGPKRTHPRRERAAALLGARALAPLTRRLPGWRGVLVLNYHRIGEAGGQLWDRSLFSATADTFDRQLRALGHCADVVSPGDVAELARRGRPGRHVALTFDDGYRDNYELAYPILRRHGARAAFFVATGLLDRPRAAWWDEISWMVHRSTRPALSGIVPGPPLALADGGREPAIAALVARYKSLPAREATAFLDRVADVTGSGRCPDADAAGLWMTWEMVREMRAAGMPIGGHTVDHPILARLPESEQARELDGCAARLSAELQMPMELFAYPVGSRDSFTAATRELLRARGVRTAFSFYGGVARFDRFDPLDVPRIHVDPTMTPALAQASALLPGVLVRP